MNAENMWIRYVQELKFMEEIRYLRNESKTSPPPNIRNLGLYVDDDGLLKCKGRLNTRRVSKFENPAKGRPQTSSLRSAVIRQNVNKMARERGL